jgi:hypothetical protein
MRECEHLKRALGVPSTSKKTKSNSNDDRNGGQRFENRNVDLIDEIIVTADPILAMTIGNDVIITTTTAAMTHVMTTVVTTTLISAIEVIVAMIAMMIATMTGVTTDVATMTTTAKTATARSGHLRHHPKGATPMVHSRRPTVGSTSSSVVAKRPKPTDRLDRTPGRSGTST